MHWGKQADVSSKQAVPNSKFGIQNSDPPSAIRCPLCGKEFHADEALRCAACALARKCGLVMCPNCSYEFAV